MRDNYEITTSDGTTVALDMTSALAICNMVERDIIKDTLSEIVAQDPTVNWDALQAKGVDEKTLLEAATDIITDDAPSLVSSYYKAACAIADAQEALLAKKDGQSDAY